MNVLPYKEYKHYNRCMAEARAEWVLERNRGEARVWLGRALRYVWVALGYETTRDSA